MIVSYIKSEAKSGFKNILPIFVTRYKILLQ